MVGQRRGLGPLGACRRDIHPCDGGCRLLDPSDAQLVHHLSHTRRCLGLGRSLCIGPRPGVDPVGFPHKPEHVGCVPGRAVFDVPLHTPVLLVDCGRRCPAHIAQPGTHERLLRQGLSRMGPSTRLGPGRARGGAEVEPVIRRRQRLGKALTGAHRPLLVGGGGGLERKVDGLGKDHGPAPRHPVRHVHARRHGTYQREGFDIHAASTGDLDVNRPGALQKLAQHPGRALVGLRLAAGVEGCGIVDGAHHLSRERVRHPHCTGVFAPRRDRTGPRHAQAGPRIEGGVEHFAGLHTTTLHKAPGDVLRAGELHAAGLVELREPLRKKPAQVGRGVGVEARAEVHVVGRRERRCRRDGRLAAPAKPNHRQSQSHPLDSLPSLHSVLHSSVELRAPRSGAPAQTRSMGCGFR